MKYVLFALVAGSLAFGKNINKTIVITKGPFYVPVTNSAYDVLGPDFHSEGEGLVFLTAKTISFEFPRLPLVTVDSVKDADADYYHMKKMGEVRVRVGFEEGRLSWFFSRGRNWDVKIAREAEKNGVESSGFSKLDDEKITRLAEIVVENADVGGLVETVISHPSAHEVLVTGTLAELTEDSDDPVAVGKATVRLVDGKDGRSISLSASVKDRE
ncbi:MAG: hypothetical protein HYR96_10820 [Deltaproteobacteria bacterium]|nr:hypothetical protein [Deltaproteobacteria bacterium]MBI3293619.1 hypothetical protein [Deltaproteobacteria bacterium]